MQAPIPAHIHRLAAAAAVLGLLAGTGAATAQQHATIAPLSAEARTAMTGKSWHEGCPVTLDDLAAVSVVYLGFDGATHRGTIVVHRQLARDAASIFDALYEARFPIARVEPWDDFGSRVYAEQDATVGFYCQKAQDDTQHWSSHAYGYAIDINPLENPFHDPKEGWWPPSAARLAPRDGAPGKITPTSVAFKIFADHGWAWGGFYQGEMDYMHFFKVTDGSEDAPPDRPYAATGLKYQPHK